jgi:8-oxo-dGTP diphosphatase
MSDIPSNSHPKHVRVGVGVIVKDPRDCTKIFCGIRKGSHGAGSLALPGGHLELYETWHDCAKREVLEEMNLALTNVRFAHVTNDIMRDEDKHYVTIFMMGDCVDPNKVAENMEPHKCAGWKSYSWSELREILEQDSPPLFGPLKKLVQEEPESVQHFLDHDSDALTLSE